jgi:hypothetical protein
MPKIHLPFKRKVYRFFSTVLILVYFTWEGLIVEIIENRSSFQDLWAYILPGFAIVLILVSLDLLTLIFQDDRLVKLISFNDEFSFNIIEERANWNYDFTGKVVDKRVHWNSIKDVEIFDNFEGIKIRLDTGNLVKIQYDYENFYLLLIKLSDNTSFDKERYSKFSNDLEACPICGMIAKFNTKCYSCLAQFPEGNIEMDVNLKEAQILYFILQMDKKNNVNFFKKRRFYREFGY